MRIRVTKQFKSRALGNCEEGQVVDCDPSIGKYVVSSRLGEEVEEEAVMTKDVPMPARRIRKEKKIRGKKVETAAVEIEQR